VIILVNGVKQREGIYSANFLEQINVPPEAIDRIEVVRGPMSVIYGTGAFFGAINIKTRQEFGEEEVSQVSVSYGSQKTARLFARAAGREGDFLYAFNGTFYDTEGINADMEKIAGPAFAGVTTKEKLESTEKYFNFSGVFKGFSMDVSYSETRKEDLFLLPPVDDNLFYFTRMARVAFGYEHEFSDKVRANVKMNYSFNRNEYSYDFIIPNLYGEQESGASYYEVEMNLFANPSPQFGITMGVNYNRFFDYLNRIDLPLIGFNHQYDDLADGEAVETLAGFAQLNFKPSDKFKIVAGARIEQVPEFIMERKIGVSDATDPNFGTITTSQATYSQTDIEFIPRVALILTPTAQHSIKLLYGRAINRPSIFQSIDLFVSGISLEPEIVDTIELNYIGSLSPKFTMNLSLFRNILDKLIFRTQVLVGGTYINTFANVGNMSTTGGELTLTLKPFEDFTLELSGMYQDTKDEREGFEDIVPGYSPKFLGYIKASLFLSKDISIAVTGNYVGEMESFYDENLGARLGQPVDGYFLLGANLRIRNLGGSGMFLNIRGSNLLDQEIFYPTTSNNNLYAANGTIGRGMSFIVTMGYKFIPIPQPQP
jgi:outer membrane receptor protein involved in Fe transport